MRGSWIVVAAAAALALSACAKHDAAKPPEPPAPAATAAPPAAETPPAPVAPDTAPAAAAPPAKPEVVHFSPADYGVHERRVAALIANAETRDTSGETKSIAAQGQAQRERCATKACINGSYAAEEAKLRKWEGAGDIK
jgi:hypothetical protein